MQNDRAIFTPCQLNTLARDLLESNFQQIWIEGELGSVTRPASGHLYFTLKDSRAQIKCAFFKTRNQLLTFIPQEGMQVLARGKLTLYEARGDYQLVIEHLEEAGEGALQRAFEQLKNKLQLEGLFSEDKKKPLPEFIQRLCIITSATGAAIHDILSVLKRRFPLLEIDIFPSLVQGEQAPAQLIQHLNNADRSGRYDAILLTRGGGSLEDLWAFNNELLVRAIAAATTPVISAVGHETDVTLTDFVADIRAATPSVAAELLVPHQDDLFHQLKKLESRLNRQFQYHISSYYQRCDRIFLRLNALHPITRLQQFKQRQAFLIQRLNSNFQQKLHCYYQGINRVEIKLRSHNPEHQLNYLKQRLISLQLRPQSVITTQLQQKQHSLISLARTLESVSPLATLSRGYSILNHSATGEIIRSVSDMKQGDLIEAKLADGTVNMVVTKV